jgi:hypothetical protein
MEITEGDNPYVLDGNYGSNGTCQNSKEHVKNSKKGTRMKIAKE